MFRRSRILRFCLLAAVLVTPAWAVRGQEPPIEYVPGPPVVNQHGIVSSQPIISEPVIVEDHVAPVPMDGAMGCSEEAPPKKGWRLFSRAPENHPVHTAINNELHRYGLGCYATIDTVGCTSCGSELTFIFGSCRSFFGEPCGMGGGTRHPYVPSYQGTVDNAPVAPTYGTYNYAPGFHGASLYPGAPPGAGSGSAQGASGAAPYGAFSGCNCGASGRW